MRAAFVIENLGCANCAAKMERKISKIQGVRSASVIFMSKKLIIDADETDISRIEMEAGIIVKSIEPDSRLIRG
ncbi:MAG: cation transporter [Methanomassiliicoccaceae archaeon]|nr:cation transporter [Methanomassiliicoccaceae archaeon]